MPKIENLKRLQAKLRKRVAESKRKDDTSVTTGFSQRYAVWVHEVKAKHNEGQEWKFLEKPAREKQDEIGRVAIEAYKLTKSMQKALLVGGMRLQREAQNLVPVDTGALKASAFTDLTRNEDIAANAAYGKSEVIRHQKQKKRKK